MPITLSEEQLNQLRDAKARGNEALSDLDKADRAGIDVKDQRKTLIDQLAKIDQMLSVYG